MDPLTQGAIGAVLPQALSRTRSILWATLCGFLSGLAPDLDVLISSETDPLLFLEYHRQFSHSLLFIPIGASLCALLLHFAVGRRKKYAFPLTWLFCFLGYSTHALLDACTTYGTVLLWPFSQTRFAWNVISIIDPLFTLPIVVLLCLAVFKRNRNFSKLGILWALSYLLAGLWQHDRAVNLGWHLAEQRGHNPITLDAKPSFANILVWKIVYEEEGRFYVDAVRVGYRARVYEGESILKLDLKRDFSWLDDESRQANDIERFRWFSRDHLAKDPDFPDRIVDIRYSLVPNQINSMWSIELSEADPERHVSFITHRTSIAKSGRLLWEMIFLK